MAPSSASASALHRRSFSRILLIKPSSLGDIVHALPVLHALRVRYPQARIDWLVAKPLAPLIAGHPEITELILFDRRRFGAIGRNAKATAEFFHFLRDLRRRRYELVVDLQGLFRSGFLCRVTGAGVRLGFRGAREGASMFYTHRIPIDDPDRHAVDRNLRVAAALGIDDVAVEFRLPESPAIRADVEAQLAGSGLTPGQTLIAVFPAARWETKVWASARFAAVIDELHEQSGARCALLGSQDEAARCREIADACRRAPINLAGRTDPAGLVALIRRADLVLCHDSAAAHLAVALERPLVCLVGPTNPRRTGPYGRMDAVVSLDLECAPCYFRRLAQCPNDHRCMRDLDVAAVVAAARQALSRRSPQVVQSL